jgi:peroxin-2
MTSDNFAAAQERVLARRTKREAEHLALQQAREASHQAINTAVPFPFNRVTPSLLSFWSTIQGRDGTKPVFRVGQVDAELLDEELLELLRGQAGEALKYYGPHIRDDWSEEILLVLRAILFKLSIWDNDASYGAALQNLRYTDARVGKNVLAKPSRWQKGLYGFLTVVGRYSWEKWESWLVNQEDGYTTPSRTVQRMSQITTWASTTHSIAAFLSFLIFLVNGRYRTLTDRLLRLRLVSPVNQVSREVSFEYLNRQLVWHAFTEFLLFLLPLVGISRWRRWLSRAWRETKSALKSGVQDRDSIDGEKSGPLAYLPERTCAICYQDQNSALSEAEILGANTAAGGVIGSATTDVVNPYETDPCGCVYCFVCIVTRLESNEGSGWPCLRCGELVQKCRPWTGDNVVKRLQRRSGSKNVWFAGPRQYEEGVTEVHPTEL